jgi:hypothetical protein
MKVKLAFIGNSSSSSWYVVPKPPPASLTENNVTTPGEFYDGVLEGGYLGRVYKQNTDTKWAQTARATVVVSKTNGDVQQSVNTLSFRFQYTTKSGSHEAANITPDTFDPADSDGYEETFTINPSGDLNNNKTWFWYDDGDGDSTVGTPGGSVEIPTLSDDCQWRVWVEWHAATSTFEIYAQHYSPTTTVGSTYILLDTVTISII